MASSPDNSITPASATNPSGVRGCSSKTPQTKASSVLNDRQNIIKQEDEDEWKMLDFVKSAFKARREGNGLDRSRCDFRPGPRSRCFVEQRSGSVPCRAVAKDYVEDRRMKACRS